jgi:hypothetical protein
MRASLPNSNYRGALRAIGIAGISPVSAEKRFHVYDLGESRPEATRLVCYLLTEESVVSMPLQFSDEHSAEPAKR